MGCKEGLFMWVLLVSLTYILKEVSCDSFLINCGSYTNFTTDNRVYLGEDYTRRYLSTPIDILANTSTNANLVLHKSARIFNGNTLYKFPIEQMGKYFIRFHFFPFTYQTYNLSNAKMYVIAGSFELMSNYTPPTFGTIKEYSINVHSKSLEITLKPAASNSVAFLNALEVFLVPNELIPNHTTLINSTEPYIGLPTAALETIFRVNMGGSSIVDHNNDTIWRTWEADDSFIKSAAFSRKFHNIGVVHYRSGLSTTNIAPIAVYGTCRRFTTQYNSSNITWTFNVDLGFSYFVRFHFCDIVSSSRNKMFFNVFVNSWLVYPTLNLTGLAHGYLATPIYIDYVTPMVKGNDFSISISPTMTKNTYGAILNGLEIMKISNHEASLAVVVSSPPFQQVSSNNNHKEVFVWVIIVGVSLLGLAIILYIWIKRSSESLSLNHSETTSSHSTNSVPLRNMGISYPLAYIEEATNNFDESRVIGKGASGKVYMGFLRDGRKVAVKKIHIHPKKNSHQYRTKIELLSQINHHHLVSLIGYCDESNEKILIYDYMENGDLRNHIFKENCLNWEQRVNICIGAARGLDFLHNYGSEPIIHRDVKAANILLDENFDAKVYDFGLLKVGVKHEPDSLVTAPSGTLGYMDPDYYMRYEITQKVDVYSFGIVLLEVLCGKPILDQNREPYHLIEWAGEFMENKQFEHIIDPHLQDEIKQEALELYGETMMMCIDVENVDNRPSMSDVVHNLNLVKRLQLKGTHLDEATTSGQHEDTDDEMMEAET